MAQSLEVTERTVWRWLAAAERDESATAEPGARAQSKDRFSVTPEVRRLLALWRGNVAAVHRELIARAAKGEGEPPPSGPGGEPPLYRVLGDPQEDSHVFRGALLRLEQETHSGVTRGARDGSAALARGP